MNQEERNNRFIFSEDYYDKLDDNIPDEKEVSFEVNKKVTPIVEKVNKENNDEVVDNKTNMESVPNFFSEHLNKDMEVKKQDDNIEINTPIVNEDPSMDDVVIPVKENDLELSDLKPISTLTSEVNIEESKFDVDSGINTDLEKEIMRSRIQPEIKAPIVQNSTWLEPEQEKVAYRATRNRQTMIPKIKDEPEELPIPNIIKRVIKEEPKVVTVEKIPEVINIDEELNKLEPISEVKVTEVPVIDAPKIVVEEDNFANLPVTKSTLLEELSVKEQQTGKISILARYGDDFCSRDYITNPAIGREEEIKQLILILLTPEKSGILVGKPGIGKTSIVEGLAYRLQRNKVPDALKGYRIVSVKTTSLLGTLSTGETRLQTLIDELKDLDKIILFIDEIHMLMGATSESSLDFANMFKESLGRGSIKMIGATTTDEYERYVLRDKAFVRRFQRVDVEEPSREHTIKILMGTLPKIEKNTGATLKYSKFIQSEIMAFIVDITTEYKRVYGIGSRYPDICLTLLSQAFSQAVFNNRKEVNIFDIRNAIENSKNIYPDVIRKELFNFDIKFKQLIDEEKAI